MPSTHLHLLDCLFDVFLLLLGLLVGLFLDLLEVFDQALRVPLRRLLLLLRPLRIIQFLKEQKKGREESTGGREEIISFLIRTPSLFLFLRSLTLQIPREGRGSQKSKGCFKVKGAFKKMAVSPSCRFF